MKTYTVTFIKDRDIDGWKEGDKYGPVDKAGYMNLLNGGWIEDEHNLVKTKKQKFKKEEEDNN